VSTKTQKDKPKETPLSPAELRESYKDQLVKAQAEAIKWTNTVHTLNGAIQAIEHIIALEEQNGTKS
jgi:hypothetical protein